MKYAILAYLNDEIHHCNPQMPVNNSHFVLLLPSSLFLPAAPIIDAGSTQPPTASLTVWNVFGMQPVLYGSAEVCVRASSQFSYP
jgi:hypothetical protein